MLAPRNRWTWAWTRSEILRYSLPRAISAAQNWNGGALAGFEGEIDEDLRKRFGAVESAHTVYVPLDVIRHYALQIRADVTGSLSAGGYLVQTNNVGFVGLALPRSIFGTLGVQVLEGLVGNVNVPVMKTAGAQTDISTETTQANTVTPTYGQASLTPKMEGAYFEASRVLLLQTSPSVQAFLVAQLLAAFAARLEFLALQGSGSAGQPQGLLGAATGSVSGTALALAGVLAFQTQLADRLGPSGAYVTTQAIAALLAARQKATATSSFLWEGSAREGRMGGFPALSTSNMPSGKMLFGAWQYALFAGWGTVALEVNPFANFQQNLVGMRILHPIDIAALDPSAFSVATAVS